jgi:PTS system nitrogen regulatory IIA component
MLNPAYAAALGTTGHLLSATASTARNAIAAILTPADILLDVDVPTKNRALEEAARHVAARHGLANDGVHASLVEREKFGSTALGRGIAIPHARVTGLSQPIAAFVRLKWAIAFDAPDGRPVSDMLCLLVPRRATEAHLLLLAEVAEMFCDKSFREELRSRVHAADVHEAFVRWRRG